MNLTSTDYELLVYHEFGSLNHYSELAGIMIEIENGDVSAMETLAVLYEYGHVELDIPRDAMKRNYWYYKAAQHGSVQGAYFYGNYLVSDSQEGRLEDVAKKGMDYMIKAADNGYARAQYMVGLAYNNGFIVNKSTVKASEYLLLAAANGEKEALEVLNEMHL